MSDSGSVEKRKGVTVISGVAAKFMDDAKNREYTYPMNGLPKITDASLSDEEVDFAEKTSYLAARK